MLLDAFAQLINISMMADDYQARLNSGLMANRVTMCMCCRTHMVSLRVTEVRSVCTLSVRKAARMGATQTGRSADGICSTCMLCTCTTCQAFAVRRGCVPHLTEGELQTSGKEPEVALAISNCCNLT